MRNLRTAFLAVTAATLLAGPALAQPPGGGRGGMQMGRGGVAMLIGNASVQEELKLTDEQKTKIKDFAAKQREAMAGLRDLSPEERREKMQEMNKTNTEAAEKLVKEHLTADQAKRFKQIVIQQAGVAAFAMEDVSKTRASPTSKKTSSSRSAKTSATTCANSSPAAAAGISRKPCRRCRRSTKNTSPRPRRC